MIAKKKITLGVLTLFSISTPIIVVVSCNKTFAKGNKEIHLYFSYKRDGVSHFQNFKDKINEQWANKLGDEFILKITNKSSETKTFTIQRKNGRFHKDKMLIDIETFLNQ